MNQQSIAFALGSGVLWLASVQGLHAEVKPAAEIPLTQQVEEVATRLEGVMDTSAQAMANPKAPHVQMTTCRIPIRSLPASAEGTVFLYQEQALAKNLAQPYRQRFLQIMPSRYSNTVRSLTYKPANPAQWSGWCQRSLPDRAIQFNQLGSPVCSVYLKRSHDQLYEGNTQANGCPANVRGAVRITNHVVLRLNGMDTWDRGFDADGKQVWGAQADSYQYRRLAARKNT